MSASELTVERLLRAHAPHAPETLRARVLALEPVSRSINLPSRRFALVALSEATTRATRIVTSLGGYAQSVEYRTPQNGSGASYLELRVPTQNVKIAIARLAGLGTLVSQELSVTDLQQRFQTQSAQIAQLRRRVAALRAALLDPSLPEAQKVLLQIRLAESKRALAQRLHARKGT